MDLRSFNKSEKAYSPEEWEEVLVKYFEFMKTQYWNKAEAIKSGENAGKIVYVPIRTPLTKGNLAIFASISEDTIDNYASNKPGYENHFGITTRALKAIKNNQIEGALVGEFNSNLVARMQGIKDGQDIVTNGKDINQGITFITEVTTDVRGTNKDNTTTERDTSTNNA